MSEEGREFVFADPSKCIGCGLCELACVIEKEKNLDATKSRIKVVHLGPLANMAVTCRLCESAPCVRACPRDALWQDEKGIIRVDDEKCDVCGWCVEACPYGAIVLDTERATVLICDLCDGEPKCMEFCPTEALFWATEEEASKMLPASLSQIRSEIKRVVELGAWNLLFARAMDVAGKVEEKLKALARRAEELRVVVAA
ncbi:MAG TPA: 4Fe-4S dicluster domain-containing protein [Candidatus Bathyarchaeota archaeon]|nr:4Fe-4S dicluster domain-containing protein [Candidatus Bathyarchaeota archaeon]